MNRMLTINVLAQLFRRDFLSLKREFIQKFIDTLSIFITTAVVFGYFMPTMGENYGTFILVGAIGIFGFFEVAGKVSELLADLDGPKTISQSLIMPIRSEGLFLYIALFWTFRSIMLSAPLFLFAKLLLPHQFIMSHFNYWKLIPIYLTANILYGVFALWLCGILKGLRGAVSLWFRVINPFFMFGAYFYTWKDMFHISPLIGKLALINPIVYVMEGLHSSTLGEEGFLPYSFCMGMLWLFILSMGTHAVVALKKRLDCV